jgi:hypothetical protein
MARTRKPPSVPDYILLSSRAFQTPVASRKAGVVNCSLVHTERRSCKPTRLLIDMFIEAKGLESVFQGHAFMLKAIFVVQFVLLSLVCFMRILYSCITLEATDDTRQHILICPPKLILNCFRIHLDKLLNSTEASVPSSCRFVPPHSYPIINVCQCHPSQLQILTYSLVRIGSVLTA